MHSSLARVVPLLLLLLLLAPTGPARAEGGGFAVAGAGNLVGSSGDARRGAARTFGLYATVGIDGRPRGVVSYVDRDARIRLHADSIEQLTVADGVATLVGSARVGGEEGQRFRLILRERRGGGAHHTTIEISRPSQPAYRADADVGAGSLRITQRAVRPAPTPTRTPSSPAARARAGDAEVSHQPGASTRLTSQDGAVQLDVPPGAVVEAASFSQADLPTAQPNEQVRLAHTFRLDARTVQSRRPLTSFRKPLRLSVAYGDADLAALGTGPAGLKLFYQDASGAWIRLPAQVDQSSRRLTAAIDHFTVFALGTGDGFEAAGAGLGLSFLDDFASLSAWTARSGGGAVAANALTTTGAASTRDLYVLANAGAYTDLTFETQVADLAPAARHP